MNHLRNSFLFLLMVFFLFLIFPVSGCKKKGREEFSVIETSISKIHQSFRSGKLTCYRLVES